MSTINARSTTTHITRSRLAALVALLAVLALVGCDDNPLDAEDTSIAEGNTTGAETTEAAAARGRSFNIVGTVRFNPTAGKVLSEELIFGDGEGNPPTGVVQRVSYDIEAGGDFEGNVVALNTVVISFVDGSIDVTGTDHFTGRVFRDGVPSKPVTLFSDDLRFQGQATGPTSGFVNWGRSRDVRVRDGWLRCNTRIDYADPPDADGFITGTAEGECIPFGRVFDVDHDDDVSSDAVM